MVRFDGVFRVIVEGALVPAIVCPSGSMHRVNAVSHFASTVLYQAIYPTLIIVLVAFHKSHTEKALTRHLSDIPTPHLATLNTITTNHHNSTFPRRSEVLAMNMQATGSGDSLEDVSACTDEEGDLLKAERIL